MAESDPYRTILLRFAAQYSNKQSRMSEENRSSVVRKRQNRTDVGIDRLIPLEEAAQHVEE